MQEVTNKNKQQEEFDQVYIMSGEIAARLGVARASIIHAKNTGTLPDPIQPSSGMNIFFWKREAVEPFIAAWETMLKAKRGPNIGEWANRKQK